MQCHVFTIIDAAVQEMNNIKRLNEILHNKVKMALNKADSQYSLLLGWSLSPPQVLQLISEDQLLCTCGFSDHWLLVMLY